MPTPPSLLSCHNCRARKVRCDKERPCGNCQRSKSECVFPLQRAARRKQGRRHDELLRRLDHLESLVDGLGGEVAITARQPAKQDSDEPEELHHQGSEKAAERGTEWMTGVVKPLLLAPRGEHHGPREDGSYPVMKGDGGRYLEEDFWTSLSGEVEGLRELLNEPTSDDEEDASPHFGSPPVGSDHYEKRLMNSLFLFSGDMETTDLRWLHPPGPHIEALSNIYWDRVDVIFKLLHRPTVSLLLKSAAADSLAIPKGGGEEALMFSIYFAAVTTLSSTECLEILGRDKPTVVGQTRHCLEIALSNADFLNSTDMQVLQAFVLYLVCLRSHNKTRSAWTLVALAVRIAQDLNLHRDGALTGFSPYETEMRRRLWWQLVVLDIRACEDRGSFPLISLELCSTKVPLNINDEDIEPNTRYPPAEREGYTEMTFSKLCQEASAVAPKFFSPNPANIDDEHKRDHWQHQIQEEVERFKDKMQKTFLIHCKPEVPIQYVVIKVVQIILTEFWLLVHYPIQTRRFAFKSKATKTEVLEAAVTHLEIDYEVVMHPLSTKFSWYFDTYVEWHPIAVALAELCVQTRGPHVEKAWKVVDITYERARSLVTDVSLWRPVKKLYQKARLAREQALREDAEKSQQGKQSPSQQSMPYSPPASSSKQRPPITTNIPTASTTAPVSLHPCDNVPSFVPMQPMSQAAASNGYTPASINSIPPQMQPQPSSITSCYQAQPQQVAAAQNQHINSPDLMASQATASLSGMNIDGYVDPVNWEDWDTFVQSTWIADPSHQTQARQDDAATADWLMSMAIDAESTTGPVGGFSQGPRPPPGFGETRGRCCSQNLVHKSTEQ